MKRIVDDLNDEYKHDRQTVIETSEKMMTNVDLADIDSHLEEQLNYGKSCRILYLKQIYEVILWCLYS
ncbi:unnamed protein product [Rotaria sordida]|uniref:Uncharacterized protein n=1 Tax=Rotaria sordida TaxID=392033 RepID=A0A814CEL4_9BILA|nr:unnamed protein product [Rotaria sordida]CAF0935952.1 unnamed protein product [Rotaria sordida]CAF0939801.1 unnamed protein product [Rotaria sordida]CAF0947836.1 unnamed protein product [Rotaria sordida]CAF1012372.1 unnamed protein product [Rotaria sordida]